MRCLRCDYIFSEEIRVCSRCGADMGMVLEKIGYFPKSSEEEFFTLEDFKKESILESMEGKDKEV